MDEPKRTAAVYGSYYAVAEGKAIRELERVAVGMDWGGNGYTTVEHVRELIDVLDLGPDKRLADLGSGAGWPGVFVASESGCRVVLSDLAVTGMRAARAHAASHDVDGVQVVSASATEVPFADATFDAVSHSDLLC
jgi:precorrin-6B methylase 2